MRSHLLTRCNSTPVILILAGLALAWLSSYGMAEGVAVPTEAHADTLLPGN